MLSLPYCSTATSVQDYGKAIALTGQTFVGKVMSLLFNMLSRFIIAFLPRTKYLLISWLQPPLRLVTLSFLPPFGYCEWCWYELSMFKFLLPVLLGIYPEVELLDHLVVLFFIFGGNSVLFSTVGWTNIHFHQQCTSFPFSSYPCQRLLLLVFFIIAILTSERWYLIVVLICISLLISDVEHLFVCWVWC